MHACVICEDLDWYVFLRRGGETRDPAGGQIIFQSANMGGRGQKVSVNHGMENHDVTPSFVCVCFLCVSSFHFLGFVHECE